MNAAVEEHIHDTIAVLGSLRHHFPAWAIWCDAKRQWTATRAPKPGEQSSPGSHLVWVYGSRADELTTRIEGQGRRAT